MKLTGKIVTGEARGRKMGKPTLNLEVENLELEPGVYAVWVNMDFKDYAGVLHYGSRPTFGDEEKTVEVHLLDFDAVKESGELEVEFVGRLRGTLKFDSPAALAAQIADDVERARSLLYNSPE